MALDRNRHLIIQVLVFIQLYRKQLLLLYQTETVPVPIIDKNAQADSYTHQQVSKPYIAINNENT